MVLILLISLASGDPETVEGLLSPAKKWTSQKKDFRRRENDAAKGVKGTLAERNINFLNERARSPNVLSTRAYTNFHPDSLARPLGKRRRANAVNQAGLLTDAGRRLPFGRYIHPTRRWMPSTTTTASTVKAATATATATTRRRKTTQRPPTTTSVNVLERGNNMNVNQIADAAKNIQLNPVGAAKAEKKASDSPQAEMLKVRGEVDDYEGTFATLVIGITFVVFFAAVGIGLVVHAVIMRRIQQNKHNKNFNQSRMKPPHEEDGTPPELRSGCGHPSFVQPDQQSGFASKVTSGMISHGNGKLVNMTFFLMSFEKKPALFLGSAIFQRKADFAGSGSQRTDQQKPVAAQFQFWQWQRLAL